MGGNLSDLGPRSDIYTVQQPELAVDEPSDSLVNGVLRRWTAFSVYHDQLINLGFADAVARRRVCMTGCF
jgi:hypothetical protein